MSSPCLRHLTRAWPPTLGGSPPARVLANANNLGRVLPAGFDVLRWRSEFKDATNQARMVATAAAGRVNTRRKSSSRQGDRSLDDIAGALDNTELDEGIATSAGGSHQQRTKQRVDLSAIEDEGLETLVKDKRSSWRAGPAKRARRNRRYEKRILRNLDLDEYGDGDGWDDADDWNHNSQ